MKQRILLVGEDSILLQTRALLLTEWDTRIKSSEAAIVDGYSDSCDVIIIGQSVKEERAAILIALARRRNPAPEILLIRFPDQVIDLGVEIHVHYLSDSPAWLPEWVRKALARRARPLS